MVSVALAGLPALVSVGTPTLMAPLVLPCLVLLVLLVLMVLLVSVAPVVRVTDGQMATTGRACLVESTCITTLPDQVESPA
jgi:hypothetical protein